MAIRDKCAEVLLQRVAILAGQALGVADCQATMIAHEVEKLRGNFRQAAHQQPFTLNFCAQSNHLAL